MKILLSSLALLFSLGMVGLSVYLQNGTADQMSALLEKCADDAVDRNMEGIYVDFGEFSRYYQNKRDLLSLFVHTSKIEEIDELSAEIAAALENGEDNADDTDFDTIAASVKKLLDASEHIIETNTLSWGNIF
jgi:hypothetical protein